MFYSLGRVSHLLDCASLLIGTNQEASGVEGRFGTVSCWFILWQQQLATLSDTFVFPRAINRGVVWFAINQSSHKYPTEAKTTKVSWSPADDYISHASPDHLCQSLLIQRL